MKTLEDTFYGLWPTDKLPLQKEVLVYDLVSFVPGYSPEYRVDFYCPAKKLIIEINGGTGKGRNGAHSSFAGLKRDYIKQNYLVLAGYKVIELDTQMAKDKQLIDAIVNYLSSGSKNTPLFDATKIPSLSNKAKQNRQQQLTESALTLYVKRKTELPGVLVILKELKKKKKSVRMQYISPWLLAHGWKRTTIGWKKI